MAQKSIAHKQKRAGHDAVVIERAVTAAVGKDSGVFGRAVALVLRHEGGYVHDPRDPGGETKFGISRRSYPRLNIAELTVVKAIRIYYSDYWCRYGFGQLKPDVVTIKLFDIAVNVGPRTGMKLLQRAANALRGNRKSLVVDGVVGPKTRRAISGVDTLQLYIQLLKKAAEYYSKLNRPVFIKGWLLRLLDF